MSIARIAAQRPHRPVAGVASLLIAVVLCLIGPEAARAAEVNLAVLLGNSGFEDDLDHSHWVSTKKSTNYLLDAPLVSPLIVPKGEMAPLLAPAGNHFVGVLNPADSDINGRLVHDPVAGVFLSGTTFTATVFANRGRLSTAPTALFESAPSEVTLQFFGWRAGGMPVVDPASDNWDRTPAVTINRSFTSWGPNGEWASQTLLFPINTELRYISLSLTAKNHKRASYAAFDLVE